MGKWNLEDEAMTPTSPCCGGTGVWTGFFQLQRCWAHWFPGHRELCTMTQSEWEGSLQSRLATAHNSPHGHGISQRVRSEKTRNAPWMQSLAFRVQPTERQSTRGVSALWEWQSEFHLSPLWAVDIYLKDNNSNIQHYLSTYDVPSARLDAPLELFLLIFTWTPWSKCVWEWVQPPTNTSPG